MNRPEIYFVDDDATVLTAMKRLLRACGYQVTVFQSAKAFLEHPVDRDDKSCLVVDIHMPGQSGIDLHRAVRAAKRDLPLVFATGAGEAARHSVGTAVAGGMLVSTFLNLVFIPVLYVVVQTVRGVDRKSAQA